MRRVRVVAVVVLLAGTLVGVTATSTMSVNTERGEGTLALAIAVNRLELSPEQMRAVRDHIADVLAAVDTIAQQRASFEDEMIRFDGTSEELDARLLAFREETAVAYADLQETIRGAVDELKDTLTIRQGEIIAGFARELRSRQAAPAMGFGPLSVARGTLSGRAVAGRTENGLLAVLQGIRGRITALVREGAEPRDEREIPESFDPDRVRERMMDRPLADGLQATESEENPMEGVANAIRERVRESLREAQAEMQATRRHPGSETGVPEFLVDLLRQLQSILDEKLALGAG